MKIIQQPRAIFLAETMVDEDGECEFLTEIGAHVVDPDDPHNVDLWDTDAPSDAERLIEHAGRMCYRSHNTSVNPNLSKVREGNAPYMENILRSKHGSVLEHANVTFAFLGVSRVFTHELVRHRAGHAFSQESLRFVRLTELQAYLPDAFKAGMMEHLYDALVAADVLPNVPSVGHREEWAMQRAAYLYSTFVETFEYLEQVQENITTMLHLDSVDGGFVLKKAITSAMRRLAPIGLGTAIVCTANHRAWRHVISMRTSWGAEEEIRKVYYNVAMQLARRYPNLYGDLVLEHREGEGSPAVIFEHDKI